MDEFRSTAFAAGAPVTPIEPDLRAKGPEPGMALCLSGGGYRAMVFHLGALWRLNEAGLLRGLKRVSSVSGGSITAGVLGLAWKHLDFDSKNVARKLVDLVIAPVRVLAGKTIDTWAVVGGLLLPGSAGDKIANAYRKHLFGERTLQDLPSDNEGPRFVINATSVQSGALWRFSKPYMADYLVGVVPNPTVEVAVAVAASSAFPPVLSPLVLNVNPSDFQQESKPPPLHKEPYISRVVLTDGGVYDNLGLETAWKRYRTILVSDAGQKMAPEEKPKHDWARHSLRVLDLIDNQVRSLRKRQLIQSYKQPHTINWATAAWTARDGAYWGIRTNIEHCKVPGALPCPQEETLTLAAVKTRLAALDDLIQERLINWGYAVCDAAIRKHLDPALPAPADFPYPASGVGTSDPPPAR